MEKCCKGHEEKCKQADYDAMWGLIENCEILEEKNSLAVILIFY